MPLITKFCIDKRHRKAYIANNFGQVVVINCQNGVVLKSCIGNYTEMSDLNSQQQDNFILSDTSDADTSLQKSDSDSEFDDRELFKKALRLKKKTETERAQRVIDELIGKK